MPPGGDLHSIQPGARFVGTGWVVPDWLALTELPPALLGETSTRDTRCMGDGGSDLRDLLTALTA